MNQTEHEVRQGELLKRLRESEGYEALVELLMDWQRLVFEGFLSAKTDEERLFLSVKGQVLQDFLLFIDNRIRSAEEHAKSQIEAARAEASRRAQESEEVVHEVRAKREPAFL